MFLPAELLDLIAQCLPFPKAILISKYAKLPVFSKQRKFWARKILSQQEFWYLINWFQKHATEYLHSEHVNQASKYGDMGVIKWFIQNKADCVTRNALDIAASNGHLNIVNFLHETSTRWNSQEPLNRAARNAHINMVKRLKDKSFAH